MCQPEINIGMIGHVDHGKTTLTQALSGKWTDTHSEEIKKGISIRLGYADATFYECPQCGVPERYSTKPVCPNCGTETKKLRTVSFVDAPGHETLMATMLSGAALMNGALLLIAANENCPQPQTKEHLMALEIIGVNHIIVVQNKIDLVSDEGLLKNYEQIKEFVKGTIAENSPVIPVSAHHNANIDVLIQAIEEHIPTPKFDATKEPKMYIARSFDVNKPGTRPADLVGGIVGGSLIQGKLNVGDSIEIRPGFKVVRHGKSVWEPIITTITSLHTAGRSVKSIKPGGLAGIGTTLDPSLTKSDGMIGRVLGHPDRLPPIWEEFTVETYLLPHAVGTPESTKVEEIKSNETLMMSVGTATTVGLVKSARKDVVDVRLKRAVCAEEGQRVAISRRIGGKYRLIGYGVIVG